MHGEGVAPRHLLLRHEDGSLVRRGARPGRVFLGGHRIERREVDAPLELRLADPDIGPLLAVAPAATATSAPRTRDYGAGGRRAVAADGGDRSPASFLLPDPDPADRPGPVRRCRRRRPAGVAPARRDPASRRRDATRSSTSGATTARS